MLGRLGVVLAASTCAAIVAAITREAVEAFGRLISRPRRKPA
ncbi:MAG: hypothetical protein ABSA40_09655 [Candidatus Dormibacteria bacterium]